MVHQAGVAKKRENWEAEPQDEVLEGAPNCDVVLNTGLVKAIFWSLDLGQGRLGIGFKRFWGFEKLLS